MYPRPRPNLPSYSLNNFSHLVLIAAAVLLASCAGSGSGKEDRTAMCRTKSEKAEKRHKDGEYWQNKEDLIEIISTCQGTGFVEQAQFMLSESHYNLEEWIEARGEYSTFIMNFPSSPLAETAAYRKAISSFNLSYSDSRDESNTITAQRDFQDFLDQHPSSPMADSVTYYMSQITDRLAEKDYQIARLYWRMDEPLAAAVYLKDFLEQFPGTRRFDEAAQLLVRCYIELEQFDQAQFHLEKLRGGTPSPKLAQELGSMQSDLEKAKLKSQERQKREQRDKVRRKQDET